MGKMGAGKGQLNGHNILAELPQKYTQQFRSRGQPKVIEKGLVLFEGGLLGDGCYWLEEGVVKVSVSSSLGGERIVAILGPGSIVGELSMIDGLPRSATVQALKDCTAIFISRITFLECLRENPDLQGYLINTLVARLRMADEETAASSFLSVRARVARALLQFAHHLGEEATIPNHIIVHYKLRHEDLAAMAGVARESASRTLSSWRKRRILKQQSPARYLINKLQLESEAQEGIS